MRYELIEVGKTYSGRKGKDRTVVALHYQSEKYGDVEYHVGDPSLTRRCWCYTFAGWVKNDAPTPIIDSLLDTLKEIRDDLYLPQDWSRARAMASEAIAKAERK